MKQYFELTRAREWILSAGGIVFGTFLAKGFGIQFILLLLSFFFVAAAIWSLNDVFDYRTDSKRNPITAGKIKIRNAVVFALGLGVIGTAIAYFFLPPISFSLVAGSVLLFVVAGWLKLNKNFPGDTLINSAISAMPFSAGYLTFAGPDEGFFIFLSILFITPVITQILQQIRDYKEDRKHGFRTLVHVLGVKKSAYLIRIVLVVSAFIFLLGLRYFPVYFLLYLLALVPPARFYFLDFSEKDIFRKGIEAQNRFILIAFAVTLVVSPFWLF